VDNHPLERTVPAGEVIAVERRACAGAATQRHLVMRQELPPASWISSRRSSPEAIGRRLGPLASELLSAMQPGDEIRSFKNSAEAWKKRCGRRGFVLLRGGNVIKVLVTAMN
jgi:hypothetical protein